MSLLLLNGIISILHCMLILVRLPEPDKQKLIAKKTSQMEALNHEGKSSALADLVQAFPKTKANLRFVLARNRKYNCCCDTS